MTVVFGLGTRLHVRMRTTLENGVLRNRQQVGRAENSFINQDEFVDTVLQSKRANFVVFKIFCYFQESVQEGSTLSLWEDTTSTCTALLEVTCCHMT